MSNHVVTYNPAFDRIFKALADPTRRRLLDDLRRQDGQTLRALQARIDMSRIAVMKHLDVLEAAGLVKTERSGRTKLHHLNITPMRIVHDRWMSTYLDRQVRTRAT